MSNQEIQQIALIIYGIILIYTIIRIIYNTDSPVKALAYNLLVLAVPVLGIIIYYTVGTNYHRDRLYAKKLDTQQDSEKDIKSEIDKYSLKQLSEYKDQLGHFYHLANSLNEQTGISSGNNSVELLINGDRKFPALLEDLRNAKHHIHMEYYIYADDDIGNQVGDILVQKAQEGVQVRFMYDDFGSSSLHRKFIKRMKDGGVEIYPFLKLTLRKLANRINYRNHRKIVVIDGKIGYVGGINVSDRYINNGKNKLYWRDTHVRIHGVSAMNLQFVFLTDWNFCTKQNIPLSNEYFPIELEKENNGDKFVQVTYSGPDTSVPAIMYSMINAIAKSENEVLVTTPYFIPDQSFIDALKICAASGVDVKLLVPGVSDSYVVNAIAQSYYQELLDMGVKMYRYQKGFVHAKQMICDGEIAFIGTANLDQRSFDLNFEVNSTTYNKEFAKEVRDQFFKDLEDSIEITAEEWRKRSKLQKFIDRFFRMLSPLF